MSDMPTSDLMESTPSSVATQIAQYWNDQILQGIDSIPLSQLNELALPEAYQESFSQLQNELFEKEMSRILGSPYFSHIDKGDTEALSGLSGWVQEHLVLPATSVIGVVEQAVERLFKVWATKPISLKAVLDDPAPMAKEIFSRARSLTPGSDESSPLPLDIIAQVCDGSDISVLSSVALAEKELGKSDLHMDNFAQISKRYLLLKERYRIGRWSGQSGNLERIARANDLLAALEDSAVPVTPEPLAQPAPVEPPPVAPPVAQPPVAAPPAPAPTPVPPAAPPIEEPALEFEEVTVAPAPAPAPEPIPAPVQAQAPPQPEPAPAPVAAPAAPASAAPVPVEVLPENKPLFNNLMSDDKRNFFTEVFFKYDLPNVYEDMVLRITQQKDLAGATIVADNELFLREVSNISDPALEFFDMIKGHFNQ